MAKREGRKLSSHGKSLADMAGSGDDGSSGLLGGGRVSKADQRMEACGALDEVSSALGLARSLISDGDVRALIESFQRDMYRMGAELATTDVRAGKFGSMSRPDVERLEQHLRQIESQTPIGRDFILPGESSGSAALDLARAVVRRAEREVVRLGGQRSASNPEVARYLNRLSLLLFVLARYVELQAGRSAPVARTSA